MNDFIRNHDLLREDYRLDGLIKFDYTDIAKRLSSYNRSGIVAVVGPYGTGKSTALNAARETAPDAQWLQFDAWRYPERKGLWDGLVIEAAKQLGQDKKALRKLDGHKSVLGRWGTPVAEIFSQVADFIPKDAFAWVGASTKGGASVSKVGEKVAGIFEKSPAKRSYELERIFSDVLLAVKKNTIYIIVEDVDRSGSDGINFLETLSFFLANTKELREKKIVTIALISKDSYEENLESYLKCVDYFEFFEPRINDIGNFMSEVFADEAFPVNDDRHRNSHQLTKDFLEGLFREFPNDMTPRKLKLILRQASNTYKLQRIDKHNPDWRVTLCLQASKYLPDDSSSLSVVPHPPSCFEEFKESGVISGSSLFGIYLNTLALPGRFAELYKNQFNENTNSYSKRLIEGYHSFNVVSDDRDDSQERSVWIFNDTFRDRGPEGYIPEFYMEY